MTTETTPHTLATLPTPTTGRVLVLALALAAIGGFAGNAVHTAVYGEAWIDELNRCVELIGLPAGADVATDLAANAALQVCRGESERLRGALQLAGWVGIALVSLAVVLLAPVVIRRRRGLRALSPALVGVRDHVGTLGSSMGLREPPKVELGRSGQRDAFCYGAPGRPVLVLPPAIAVRVGRADLFDPVVRHELAHVRHRDVSLAWLARSFLLVAGVSATIPMATTVVGAPIGAATDYLWRVVVLVALGFLVARSVLRTREHLADLAADQPESRESSETGGEAAGGDELAGGLRALLSRSAMRPVPGGWRRWVAHHPTPAERVAVLDHPPAIARTGFAEGFLPAFFAAVAAPAVLTMATSLLTGTSSQLEAFGLTAAAVGLALGGSVGVAAWRAASLEASTGEPLLHDAALAAGVGLGIAAGELAAPQNSWTGATAGLTIWALLVPGLLAAGATTLVCGLARASAGRVPRVWWIVLATSVVLGLPLWAAWVVRLPDALGVAFLPIALVFGLQGWVPVLVVLAMVGVATLSRGNRAWGDLAVGALAGVVAGGVLVAIRLSQAPLATDGEKIAFFHLVLELTIGAAVVAAAALSVLGGPRGAAAGLVALPAATVACLGAFLVLNTARGGSVDGPFLESLLHPTLVVGALGVVVVALLGLLPGGASRRPATGSSMVLAGVAALVGGLLLVLSGPFLLPDASEAGVIGVGGGISGTPGTDGTAGAESPSGTDGTASATPTQTPEPTESTPTGLDPSPEEYLTLVPVLDTQVLTITGIVDTAASLAASAESADLLRSEVAPSLAELGEQVEGITPSDPATADAHDHLRRTVAALRGYLDAVIAFHEGTDPTAAGTAALRRSEEVDAYNAWTFALVGLNAG